MSYSLEIIDKLSLISIRYDRTTTLQDRLNSLDETVEHLKEDPAKNILIDARSVQNFLTPNTQIELGSTLGKNKTFFRHNRTAVLKYNDVHPAIMGKAYIEGHVNVAEFTDKNEALEWLSGNTL